MSYEGSTSPEEIKRRGNMRANKMILISALVGLLIGLPCLGIYELLSNNGIEHVKKELTKNNVNEARAIVFVGFGALFFFHHVMYSYLRFGNKFRRKVKAAQTKIRRGIMDIIHYLCYAPIFLLFCSFYGCNVAATVIAPFFLIYGKDGIEKGLWPGIVIGGVAFLLTWFTTLRNYWYGM